MNTSVNKVAAPLDAKLELLIHLKYVSPAFYNEFVREFLTDRLTFNGFERDLINALNAIAGIMVYRDDYNVWVRYKTKRGATLDEQFEDYESAFHFAIGLLHVK